MSASLTAQPRASQTVAVAGGDLFRLALIHYGDALMWTRIALANGLSDPWLTGTATLVIPARDDGAPGGGILAV